MLNSTFITFATKYKFVNKKLAAQADDIVFGVFPVYSPNNRRPNLSLYCKYQLIIYKPWQGTQENAWGSQPGIDKIYITESTIFLETPYAKEHVTDWHKLDTVQNYKKYDTDIEPTTKELTSSTQGADSFSRSCSWVMCLKYSVTKY